MEQSAQELAGVCVREMIENLQHNVAEDKARREQPVEEYPMNGPCC